MNTEGKWWACYVSFEGEKGGEFVLQGNFNIWNHYIGLFTLLNKAKISQ